jgi:dual specificity MAP kinase phosphatase
MPSRRVLVHAWQYVVSFGRPAPDLTWVTGHLAVSASLLPRHIPSLAGLGIGAIVDLRQEATDDPDLLALHGISFLHLPVRDHSPPTQEQLGLGTRWVLDQLQAGRKALVHCREGVGRSVVLASCVLMAQGHDLESAVGLIKGRRWGIALRRAQIRSLSEFHQRLRGPGL